MNKDHLTLLLAFFILTLSNYAFCQEIEPSELSGQIITDGKSITYSVFDDRMLLDSYSQKYAELPQEILIEMIKDDNLSSYKTAAAVRVFNNNFATEVVSREKKIIEKFLLRRLNRTDSPFVQVEIMFALCRMDRYRYYNSMIPSLIQKLNHYNSIVNELAASSLDTLIKEGSNRPREARVVFNTLRNILFLSRKRLEKVTEPDPKLSRKLKLLRWSIKVLGTQELKRLPKEVVNLL
ncbi:MAG: hypothetical protein A2Y03_07480 [Omnitrophica WOR_2 bacterium GWF2_38_59]|nr:MAG: hypothetical protein A2Y03_07480 [Omnitrophica WOR_2 bacterium GWF2_38_59]OGX48818.1 MAG: hypothetical protein A2243_09050 [Omnitrophica WOR_2 bacterium RIFOXYA2_FULL_38_17]OGX53475.1 MAG: hypothetical protein A2267_07750 [Omnitrophica WOR_2 bacterium RIFOXYA12_FULL_38_10]OGX56636.1 MAG: hypothetical protein A2306_04135 [Omnitrophica WOR_2 bacterium RIFOXYB2_FULL_38_16]OGX57572.1 MAG: hypothetical protein A2447_00400 [Omnitrophica WOR_2 bacterium RIFOXYC2_FULL_38_12]HBG60837.1 hypothet